MDRAPVHTQVLRHPLDRARAGSEQRHHHVADLRRHVGCLRRGVRFQHLPREPRDPGIGVRIGDLEVAARADDAVEVVAELDVAAEHPLVHRTVRRRIVRKAHASRPPMGAEERAQHPERDADGELGRLAHRTRLADDQLLAQHDDVADLLGGEEQRFVQLPAVVDEGVERQPQRRLLADQQPERPQVGQPPRFRHQQSEPLDAAPRRRRLEQLPHGIERHPQLGLLQAARRQAEFAQHPLRVEPGAAGDFGVLAETGGAYPIDHRIRRWSVPNG